MKFRDLGLDYETAAHGVQSAVAYEQSKKLGPQYDDGTPPNKYAKHLRVGLDMRAADASALAQLLIDKGVFTEVEYLEAMRLAANEELARYEEHNRATYNLPDGAKFR